jgi:hypothetical protein
MARIIPYREENGYKIIDVQLSDVSYLFSNLDPSPVRERDLDPSTDDFIMEAAREIGPGAPIRIIFHIPADQMELATRERVTEALPNYFAYRSWAADLRLSRQWRQGWISLLIGVGFLALCLALRELLDGRLPDPANAILGEGLLISGWVAMWRPIQIFLYDWWPVWRERSIYMALTQAPVDCQAAQ